MDSPRRSFTSLFSEYETIQSNSHKYKNLTIKPCIENKLKWKFTIIPTSGTYTNYVINGYILFTHNFKHKKPDIYVLTHIPHISVLSFNGQNILTLDCLSNSHNNYSILQMIIEISTIFNVTIPKTNGNNKRLENTLKLLETQKPIYTLSDFPNIIQHECIKNNINALNEIQSVFMNDLCYGNDSIIISNGGTGKSMSVILSLLYRIFKKNIFNTPVNALIIVNDHIKVKIIGELMEILGKNIMNNFKVFMLCQKWHYVSRNEMMNKNGRNIFICTLESAINLCNKWKEQIIPYLITINIMDLDNLSLYHIDKLEDMFNIIEKHKKYEMNINIFSNSWYNYLNETIHKIFGYKHKHFIFNKYENLNHYFIDCDKLLKINELIKFIKYSQNKNKNNKGIIFLSKNEYSDILNNKLKENNILSSIFCNEFNRIVNKLINEFNTQNINYLIVTGNYKTPMHILWKCKNINMIINYDLFCFQWYFKRISICNNKNIKIISLIDNSDAKIYEKLTTKYNIELYEITDYKDDEIIIKNENKKSNNNKMAPPPGLIDINIKSHKNKINNNINNKYDDKYINDLKHKLDSKDEQIQLLQERINNVHVQNLEQINTIDILRKELETKTENENENKSNLELLVSNIQKEIFSKIDEYENNDLEKLNKYMLKNKLNELEIDIHYIKTLKKCSKQSYNYLNATKQYIETLIIPNCEEYIDWDINDIMLWICSIENGKFKKYENILKKGFISDDIICGKSLMDLSKSDLRSEPFCIKSFDDRNDLYKAFQSLKEYQKEGC